MTRIQKLLCLTLVSVCALVISCVAWADCQKGIAVLPVEGSTDSPQESFDGLSDLLAIFLSELGCNVYERASLPFILRERRLREGFTPQSEQTLPGLTWPVYLVSISFRETDLLRVADVRVLNTSSGESSLTFRQEIWPQDPLRDLKDLAFKIVQKVPPPAKSITNVSASFFSASPELALLFFRALGHMGRAEYHSAAALLEEILISVPNHVESDITARWLKSCYEALGLKYLAHELGSAPDEDSSLISRIFVDTSEISPDREAVVSNLLEMLVAHDQKLIERRTVSILTAERDLGGSGQFKVAHPLSSKPWLEARFGLYFQEENSDFLRASLVDLLSGKMLLNRAFHESEDLLPQLASTILKALDGEGDPIQIAQPKLTLADTSRFMGGYSRERFAHQLLRLSHSPSSLIQLFRLHLTLPPHAMRRKTLVRKKMRALANDSPEHSYWLSTLHWLEWNAQDDLPSPITYRNQYRDIPERKVVVASYYTEALFLRAKGQHKEAYEKLIEVYNTFWQELETLGEKEAQLSLLLLLTDVSKVLKLGGEHQTFKQRLAETFREITLATATSSSNNSRVAQTCTPHFTRIPRFVTFLALVPERNEYCPGVGKFRITPLPMNSPNQGCSQEFDLPAEIRAHDVELATRTSQTLGCSVRNGYGSTKAHCDEGSFQQLLTELKSDARLSPEYLSTALIPLLQASTQEKSSCRDYAKPLLEACFARKDLIEEQLFEVALAAQHYNLGWNIIRNLRSSSAIARKVRSVMLETRLLSLSDGPERGARACHSSTMALIDQASDQRQYSAMRPLLIYCIEHARMHRQRHYLETYVSQASRLSSPRGEADSIELSLWYQVALAQDLLGRGEESLKTLRELAESTEGSDLKLFESGMISDRILHSVVTQTLKELRLKYESISF